MDGHGSVAGQMKNLDWTLDTSPVQSSPVLLFHLAYVANVVVEAKVHVSMRL